MGMEMGTMSPSHREHQYQCGLGGGVLYGYGFHRMPKKPPRRVIVDQSSVFMMSSAPLNAHGPITRNLVLKFAPSAQVRNIRGPQVSM